MEKNGVAFSNKETKGNFFQHNLTYSSQKWKIQSFKTDIVLIFYNWILIFGTYSLASILENSDFGTFWGPAHCSYCKHHKTASDSLSN